MFDVINIEIDHLLLDPNNPRLARDARDAPILPDAEVESSQEDIRKHFVPKTSKWISDTGEADDEVETGGFDISDLVDSIREIGYHGIDRIVVRRLDDIPDKYLVIEGNRRVASIKRLLDQDSKEPNPNRKLEGTIRSTMTPIDVMVLNTEGKTAEQILHHTNLILGIRHHGSLLEWEPLPRADNIFHQYLTCLGSDQGEVQFTFDHKAKLRVAENLSIKPAEVVKALRGIIAFRQLEQAKTGIRDDHFSLVQRLVGSKKLQTHGYLVIDENTFELDANSVERMDTICQFKDRNKRKDDNKILIDPKSVPKLERLVATKFSAASNAIRDLATYLVNEVEEKRLALEDAVGQLKLAERRAEWVDSLRTLLERQAAKLPVNEYEGLGNERQYKDEIAQVLKMFKAVLSTDT